MGLADSIWDAVGSSSAREAGRRSDLAETLAELVEAKGNVALVDAEKLRRHLQDRGISESEQLRVSLLTTVPGYRELIDPNRSTKQADLDRFVHNAVNKTGLRRSEIMRLTADIALATGVAFSFAEVGQQVQRELENPEEDEGSLDAYFDQAYVIPMQFYANELSKAYHEWSARRQASDRTSMDVLENVRLSTLVNAGLPFAKYLMAMGLMEVMPEGGDTSEPLRLLAEAAEDDEVNAHAALGDYYFKQGPSGWSAAFSYYTGLGAMALTKERQENVQSITRAGQVNQRLLRDCALLLGAMLILLVVTPGASIYPPLRFLGSLCVGAGVAVLVGYRGRLRSDPYGDYRLVPLIMFALWAIYAAARMIV